MLGTHTGKLRTGKKKRKKKDIFLDALHLIIQQQQKTHFDSL